MALLPSHFPQVEKSHADSSEHPLEIRIPQDAQFLGAADSSLAVILDTEVAVAVGTSAAGRIYIFN